MWTNKLRLLYLMSLCGAWLFSLSGCAVLGRHAIHSSDRFASHNLCDEQSQIQRGKPRRLIDAAGWIWGIPSKIVLWNHKVENHNISPETEVAISDYLAANELDTVRVRLNQYRPRDDWRRLVQNKSVGAPWRYSLGLLTVAGETLLPGRLFGGDHFNPFTNTIHLYSDIPAIALHEAAHSKDFARRKWKGTYAFLYALPFVPLYHEALATRDVRAYLNVLGDAEEEAAAVRILYPAYGTYVGAAGGILFPDYSNPLYYGSILGGHLFGQWEADSITRESQSNQ